MEATPEGMELSSVSLLQPLCLAFQRSKGFGLGESPISSLEGQQIKTNCSNEHGLKERMDVYSNGNDLIRMNDAPKTKKIYFSLHTAKRRENVRYFLALQYKIFPGIYACCSVQVYAGTMWFM